MKSIYNRVIPAAIIIAAGIGLYYGWKALWFMTDDAFIAFRYVSNSILGHGYTWNPPPFRPVEGYTSFLWVVILDVVWRVFGVKPPESANTLALGFSFLTLILAAAAVMKMRLIEKYGRFRLVLAALVLLGTVTNTTFLAWSSSGLETALFDFCFILWIVVTVFGRKYGSSWLLGMTGSGVLVYLSRPDGILIILATLTLVFVSLGSELKSRTLKMKWFLSVTPLLVVVGHLLWRRFTYGEWLPNTYYAKHVAAWPEAGIRYFASFVLEYALWMWFLFAIILAVATFRKIRHDMAVQNASLRISVMAMLRDYFSRPTRLCTTVVVAATVLLHVGYYTLIIGGDHFEYRVYSYLVPLLFISFVWILNRLNLRPARAMLFLALFIVLSYPVSWTHWNLTRSLFTRKQTHMLFMPVSDKFPGIFRWYTGAFEGLQSWLIRHHVCMRRQEHKVFYRMQVERYPSREVGEKLDTGKFPIMVRTMVGVPSWVLPQVAIIDGYGLNDYVIARNKVPPQKVRYMAHDREPPKGYTGSFDPNVRMYAPREIVVRKRDKALTARDIIANETYWIDKIVRGIDTASEGQ